MQTTPKSKKPSGYGIPRDLSDELSIRLKAIGYTSDYPDDGFSFLLTECFSKHPGMKEAKTADERRSLAIGKLLASDLRCKSINEEGYRTHPIVDDRYLGSITSSSRTLIGNLLHDFSSFALDSCSFSNGAAVGLKLRDAAPFKKVTRESNVTLAALPFAEMAISRFCLWRDHSYTPTLKTVSGNVLFTVPKSNSIDRAACKEPSFNMYLQKGIGDFIRRRLKYCGIDLNDQTRNQELARIGSIDGSLATIDLSSASDSISDRLVWDFLPEDLYLYLRRLRSPLGRLPDGTLHRWNLFSTMGNGFTFELESLLFYSIAKSVATVEGYDLVGIYGDDIVVPTAIAEIVIAVLYRYGFDCNEKKTFITGHFRESCGAFYYRGIDVKPFYIRQPITDVSRVIHAANRLRGWGNVCGMSDPRLFETWTWLASFVPKKFWGGQDVDDITSLVTPHAPRRALVPQTRVTTSFDAVDDFGRYIIAQHYQRDSDLSESLRPICEVTHSTSTGRFVERPNRQWRGLVSEFPKESDTDLASSV